MVLDVRILEMLLQPQMSVFWVLNFLLGIYFSENTASSL